MVLTANLNCVAIVASRLVGFLVVSAFACWMDAQREDASRFDSWFEHKLS